LIGLPLFAVNQWPYLSPLSKTGWSSDQTIINSILCIESCWLEAIKFGIFDIPCLSQAFRCFSAVLHFWLINLSALNFLSIQKIAKYKHLKLLISFGKDIIQFVDYLIKLLMILQIRLVIIALPIRQRTLNHQFYRFARKFENCKAKNPNAHSISLILCCSVLNALLPQLNQ